eukprot:GFYU01011894.1.p1 GENE.GFYU01011894.1~~GFYU01011894.1.p1  ORF type:complete len:448 (-),score=52.36 GFYU01011894.1:68-1411(-)
MIDLILVGAGDRGSRYAGFAWERRARVRVVAVADLMQSRRDRIKQQWSLPEERVFGDWKELLPHKIKADAVMICTQDKQHVAPAIAFADAGYNLLLEKPMSVDEQECIDIARAVDRNQVQLTVCHVLRYSPNIQKIKEIISSGVIGELCNVRHTEPVGHRHFAHSFVRGAWSQQSKSSFSLLSKCCHDIDLIRYLMDSPCTSVSSFGSLKHFRNSNKPEAAGSATKCVECPLSQSCVYSAEKIYLNPIKESGYIGWPQVTFTELTPDIEDLPAGNSKTDAWHSKVKQTLLDTTYGDCVYESANDVVDNQVVSMSFENGATATLTMIAFTEKVCQREFAFFGTLGEIRTDSENIEVHTFADGKTEKTVIPYDPVTHGGADPAMFESFLQGLEQSDSTKNLTSAHESLMSHLMVFCAERSRVEKRVIDIQTFMDDCLNPLAPGRCIIQS